MAHQDTGAVDAPIDHTVDSAAAALGDFTNNLIAEEEGEQENETEAVDVEGGDDLEITDDDLTEGEEGESDETDEESPPIEAPVSLNAAEKEAFAKAPPEVQEVWAASETRRNAQVQEATTRAAEKAANAKTLAEQAAREELAQERIDYLKQFEPQEPDYRLAQVDPAQYNAELAQFNAQKRLYDAEVERLSSERAAAQNGYQEEFIRQRDQELSAIPEIANPETRDAYLAAVFEMAESLNIPRQHILENADANDVKILHQAKIWKESHEKLQQLQEKARERKRDPNSGRFKKSMKPGTAKQTAARSRNIAQSTERLKSTGSIDDAAAAVKALGIA